MNELDLILNCLICSNEMCEPTTLHCGHSFCRTCTKQWCFKYKHYNCPVCRQKSDRTLPSVNLTLKNVISILKNNSQQTVKSTRNSRPKRLFDHDNLLRKVTSDLDLDTNEPTHSEENAPYFSKNKEKTLVKNKIHSDSSLSRVSLVYFPFFLTLTFFSVLILFFMKLVKKFFK